MSSKNYSTTTTPRFQYLVTAGQLYRISQINGTTSVTNARTNNRQRFYCAASFAHFIDTLTAAGERITAEWRVASMILYIAANAKPAPEPEPIAAVCDGWQSAHFNLPVELQAEPARYYIGARKVCRHCKAAHDRALAHLASLQQQAVTPAPQYTAYVEAA